MTPARSTEWRPLNDATMRRSTMSIKRIVLPLVRRCLRSASPPVAAATTTAAATTQRRLRPNKRRRRRVDGRSRSPSACPAADHGWLAAITDERQGSRPRSSTASSSRSPTAPTDSADQADQIETLIAEKPDALVVLPYEGDALTPVALKAMEAGIPVVNVDREFSTPGAYRTLDRRRQLRHRLAGRQLLRRRAQVQGQRRRDPGPRRHLGDRAALARASPTRSSSAARAASRSSPSSRPTSTRTRACR